MHVVLLEPEIPPNTGNVARLCAATRSTLHLIEPFGFKLDDAALKRAGMDYWQHVAWHRWKNWNEFAGSVKPNATEFPLSGDGPPRRRISSLLQQQPRVADVFVANAD